MLKMALYVAPTILLAGCESFSRAREVFGPAISSAATEVARIHVERGGLDSTSWTGILIGALGAIATSIFGAKKVIEASRGAPKATTPAEQEALSRILKQEINRRFDQETEK